MFPTFLCIGAQRSGTTWLHYNLKEHPEVWMPSIKEIHYFDEKEIFDSLPLPESIGYKYRRCKTRWRFILKDIKKRSQLFDLETLRWYISYLSLSFGSRSDEWYASLFETGAGKKIGEITPEYGPLSSESVAHIHKLMPDAKIIFLMRNPMQRAWSAILREIRNEKWALELVPEAKFIKHFNSNKSKVKSSYSQIIETWKSYYPEEQVFIAFFEEIIDHPEELLLRIFEFIGLEASSKHISAQMAKKKHNASSSTGTIPDNLPIPDKFGKHLAGIYYDEIEHLHKNFGGYASNWLEDANRFLELVS